MVEQSGEPLLLSFLCCFPHSIQSLGHAVPALCRVHVRLNDVLPRLCPSLPSLRRKATFLVRLFTGTAAQSDFSSTCMSAVRLGAFADRPRSSDQGALEISRFSCMLFLSVRGFSDYAGPTVHSRLARMKAWLPEIVSAGQA